MPLIATKYEEAHSCAIGYVTTEHLGHNSTWDCPKCGKVWVLKHWNKRYPNWVEAWPLRTLWHAIKVAHLP